MTTKLYRQVLLFSYFVAAFLFFASLRFGQPIFIDDLIYLMISSRFFVEDGNGWWFYPQCLGTVTFPYPFIWYPVAVFRALLGKYLLFYVSGLDLFVVARATIVLFLSFYIAKLSFSFRSALFLPLLLSGLLLLGSNPAFVVNNRPENSMLFLLLLSLVLSVEGRCLPKYVKEIEPVFHSLFFLLGISLHPSMSSFTPFFVSAVFDANGSSRLSKYLGLVLLTVILLSSINTWNSLFTCKVIPHVEAFFTQYSIRPHDLLNDPTVILRVRDYLLDIFRFSFFLSFSERKLGGMLVASRSYNAASEDWINFGIHLITIFLVSCCLLWIVYSILFRRKSFVDDLLQRQSALMFVGLLLWCSIRGKLPYVVPLMMGVTSVCFTVFYSRLLLYASAERSAMVRNASNLLVPILLFLPLSLFTCWYYYGDGVSGFDNRANKEHYDLLASRTPEMIKPELAKDFLNRCGISKLDSRDRFAIDESTFFLVPELPNLIFMGAVVRDPLWAPTKDFRTNWDLSKARGYLVPCDKYPFLDSLPHLTSGNLCCSVLENQ